MWTMLMQTIASARETGQSPAEASRSTGAMVPIVSAVPAGEVIARDDVLGITSPQADTIETTMGVVRFPGRPPMETLKARHRGPCRPYPSLITAHALIPMTIQQGSKSMW